MPRMQRGTPTRTQIWERLVYFMKKAAKIPETWKATRRELLRFWSWLVCGLCRFYLGEWHVLDSCGVTCVEVSSDLKVTGEEH